MCGNSGSVPDGSVQAPVVFVGVNDFHTPFFRMSLLKAKNPRFPGTKSPEAR